MGKMGKIGIMLALACGCSSPGVDAAVAVEEIDTSICAKAAMCYPALFATRNPGGVTQCEQESRPSMPPKGKDACSQSQLDACLRDLSALDCGAFAGAVYGVTALPVSCKGC